MEKMAEISFSDNYNSAAILGARFRSENSSYSRKNTNDETENKKLLEANVNRERRRSRAVLYQLSGHYKQDRIKHKLKINSNLLNSTQSPLPEYKTTSIGKSQFVLTHFGSFKTCWDWLILIATFYVAIIVPYNASFVNHDKTSIVSDIVVENLFIIDIILNFRTTYVNQKGEVVSNPKAIATNYFKSWFVVDFLSAIPFDLLYASNVFDTEEAMFGHIHLVKLTRLLRLARILQKMDRYSHNSGLILSLLMFSFTLIAHWLACIWYVISEYETSRNDNNWDLGWIHRLSDRLKIPVSNLTYVESYVTALYFTCSSLTSVGFGNVSANTTVEKIFSIFVMLIGVVFGNVTAIIQRIYARRFLYHTKWRDLKDFFVLHQIPNELKQRMQDYFQTIWSLNQGIDIQETLKEFPEELRGDTSMHLNREFLQLPIFASAAQGCLKLISLHIRANFCAPGEYLIRKGDALNYIYYICNGSMEVIQNNMVVAILGKSDLVGCDINKHLKNFYKYNQNSDNNDKNDCNLSETLIISNSDVRALTYCDLKSINIKGLLDVLKMYPDFRKTFAHDIQHDLTYNVREDYEYENTIENILHSHNDNLPRIVEDDYEDENCLDHNQKTASGGDEHFSNENALQSLPSKKENLPITNEQKMHSCPEANQLHRDISLMRHEVQNLSSAINQLIARFSANGDKNDLVRVLHFGKPQTQVQTRSDFEKSVCTTETQTDDTFSSITKLDFRSASDYFRSNQQKPTKSISLDF